MSTNNDGVNPLRPYYIRPSIGERVDHVSAPSANPFAESRHTTAAASGTSYSSKARDMFDLDYKSYLNDDSPSMTQNVKELLNDLVWKYTSVAMGQPFEVAKTILQARNQDENAELSSVETEVFARQFSSQGLGIDDVWSAFAMWFCSC
jgi:fusion and transport protein UGO1